MLVHEAHVRARMAERMEMAHRHRLATRMRVEQVPVRVWSLGRLVVTWVGAT